LSNNGKTILRTCQIGITTSRDRDQDLTIVTLSLSHKRYDGICFELFGTCVGHISHASAFGIHPL